MNTTGRLLAFAVLAACVCPSIAAQSESFADFRKKVLSDFNDFRSSVLENYDKFLEGAWEDFDQIKGEKSNPVPKPRTAPAVGTTEPPVINTAPTLPAPVTATTPTPKQSPAPKSEEKPVNQSPAATSADRFSLADIPFEVPHIDYNISRRLSNKQEFGRYEIGRAHV